MRKRFFRWLWGLVAALPWVGLQAQADLPLLLGRMEMPALMVSAQRLSGLMEKSSPGSSASLALGIAALSFNPQLQHFDLTKPMVLFLYAMPEEQGGGLEWCFSLGKKSDSVPEVIEEGKNRLHVKDAGERCFVSRVPGLAEVAAMTDLPGPAASPGEEADLVLTLWPATGLERHRTLLRQVQGEGAKLLFRRAAGTGPAAMAAAHIYHLRFRLFERLLDQVREVTVALRLGEDGLACTGALTPLPDTELEVFTLAQTPGEDDPKMVALPEVAGWAGALHLGMTPAVREVLCGYFRDLAMESADHVDKDHLGAVKAVVDAWSGQATSIQATPGAAGEPILVHRLDLGQGQTGLFPEGEGGGSTRLDQYPGHPELHLTLIETKGEVIVTHYDAAADAIRGILGQAMAGTAAETPLYRGEILFRNRHAEGEMEDGAVPAGEAIPQPAPEQLECFLKFQPEGTTFRAFIPAGLLDRLDPRKLGNPQR